MKERTIANCLWCSEDKKRMSTGSVTAHRGRLYVFNQIRHNLARRTYLNFEDIVLLRKGIKFGIQSVLIKG